MFQALLLNHKELAISQMYTDEEMNDNLLIRGLLVDKKIKRKLQTLEAKL